MFSHQAGWECDACRKAGLEIKRRCGWLGGRDDSSGPPVWARKQIAITTCPKSYVTADSQALVEDFLARWRLRGMQAEELSAKQVEAFGILENELAAEMKDGQRSSRQAI